MKTSKIALCVCTVLTELWEIMALDWVVERRSDNTAGDTGLLHVTVMYCLREMYCVRYRGMRNQLKQWAIYKYSVRTAQ